MLTFAVMGTSLVWIPAARADSFQEKIDALNAQISQQQATASQLHAQADTLNNKLAGINAQAAAVSAQLQLNRAKQAQTAAAITDAKVKLESKKQILNANIRQVYQQSRLSPLEMLASSKNFSDYVDKQQYQDKIKDHIQEATAAITKLKADLEKRQADLAVIASQQAGLAATLAQQRAEAAQLLASTQGEENAYQSDIKNRSAAVTQLKAQQAAAIRSASRFVSGASIPGASGGRGGSCDNGSGNGGYPTAWCNAEQDAFADSWGMYVRECVSYAAWKRSAIGRPVPGGWGNANQWPGAARRAGYTVDGSPRVGDAAVYMPGSYGHVMIVEQVKSSTVLVSQMNGDNDGHFSYGEWPISSLQFIH